MRLRTTLLPFVIAGLAACQSTEPTTDESTDEPTASEGTGAESPDEGSADEGAASDEAADDDLPLEGSGRVEGATELGEMPQGGPSIAEELGMDTEDGDTDEAEGSADAPESSLTDPTNDNPIELTLTAERCTIEGHAFTGTSTMETIGNFEVFHGQLWIVDGDENVRRFDMDLTDGCRLTLDTTFGEGGVMDFERDADTISSGGDTLVVSTGLFEAYVFGADGTMRYTCDAPSLGHVYVHPTGEWALASFMRSEFNRVTFGDEACEVERGAVEFPVFRSGQRLAFIGDQTIIGGTLAEEYDGRNPLSVGAADGDGLAWRHGNITVRFDDAGYGYVHAIEGCGDYICVLDSNMRRMQVVRPDGSGWQTVEIDDVLGFRYPWLEDMDVADDGTVFIVAAQERDDDESEENIDGFIAVLTGF